jgi:hypothetical protein
LNGSAGKIRKKERRVNAMRNEKALAGKEISQYF